MSPIMVKLDKDTLVVRAPLNEIKRSRSGKSTVVATSRGQQYIGMVHGQPTYLQFNVMQMESGTRATTAGVIEIDKARTTGGAKSRSSRHKKPPTSEKVAS